MMSDGLVLRLGFLDELASEFGDTDLCDIVDVELDFLILGFFHQLKEEAAKNTTKSRAQILTSITNKKNGQFTLKQMVNLGQTNRSCPGGLKW
ncbi:hypothetical protein HanRHA438_Chr07g0303821 [Helianthus annuus]|nr:hypothetical protein HanRHA438_Chr07g0303821 [Helianthus annuus]